MAYNPFQRFQGAFPAQQGGGAVGESSALVPMSRTPASAFTGFSIPSAGGRGSSLLSAQPGQDYWGYSAGTNPLAQAAAAGGASAGPAQNPLAARWGGGPPAPAPGGYHPQDVYGFPAALAQQLLSGTAIGTAFGKGGWGSPDYMNAFIDQMVQALRDQASQQAGGLQNRAQTAASLYGAGDPSRAAFASLQGALQGQSDTARLLNQANLQGFQEKLDVAKAWQDMLKQLLFQQLGGSYSHWNSQEMVPKGGVTLGLPGGASVGVTR